MTFQSEPSSHVSSHHLNPEFCPRPCRYFQTGLPKSLKADRQEVNPIEMSSLVGPINDLGNTPFRSLRPRSSIGPSGGGVSFPKTQGPVVCSVAPNLPVRPPSSSDNDSIRKNHWEMDYEGLCLLVLLKFSERVEAFNDAKDGKTIMASSTPEV